MITTAPPEGAREISCPSTVMAEPGRRVWEPIIRADDGPRERVWEPKRTGAATRMEDGIERVVLLVGGMIEGGREVVWGGDVRIDVGMAWDDDPDGVFCETETTDVGTGTDVDPGVTC